MVVLILLSIVFVIVMITDKNLKKLGFTYFEMVLGGIMSAMVIYTLIAMPVTLLRFKTETTEERKIEIYSIKNETGLYGHFCIGTGTIESKVYYYYYTKNDNGYILNKIDAEQVYIEECEDLETIGYVCTYGKQLAKEDWWYNFGRDSMFIDGTKTTIIKVPKNTMQIEFKID